MYPTGYGCVVFDTGIHLTPGASGRRGLDGEESHSAYYFQEWIPSHKIGSSLKFGMKDLATVLISIY